MGPESLWTLFSLPEPIQTIPLKGGANNRVYKWEFKNHPPLVLKQYFQHPNDPRPRLQTEFSFLAYAWNLGLRNIPQPLFASPTANAAIYSYIEGSSITSPSSEQIHQAIEFFLRLNHNKSQAEHLPRASEGCLSIADYLTITEPRINRASQAFPPLKKAWIRIKETACKAALHYRFSLTTPLELKDLCLSPSDFGFHNALLHKDGQVYFIDFEYAGWDDPCKTLNDFFCQPKVPVPKEFFPIVSQAMASIVMDQEQFLKRAQVLRSVVQIKWCCILLNSFTQTGKTRRAFSQSEETLEIQMEKVKQLLQAIEETHGIH